MYVTEYGDYKELLVLATSLFNDVPFTISTVLALCPLRGRSLIGGVADLGVASCTVLLFDHTSLPYQAQELTPHNMHACSPAFFDSAPHFSTFLCTCSSPFQLQSLHVDSM